MLSRDLQRIVKIRDYCLNIQDTVARFGESPEGFLLDSDYQQSIAFSILQIGELTGGLYFGERYTTVENGIAKAVDTLTYTEYQKNVKPKPVAPKKKSYVCKVCGYVFEGEELPPDFICPICKHDASAFELRK